MHCAFARRDYEAFKVGIPVEITGQGNNSYCYVTINGVGVVVDAGSFSVGQGEKFLFSVKGNNTYYPGWLKINGTTVLNVTSASFETYEWVIPNGANSVTIDLHVYVSPNGSIKTGQITVTTS